MKNYSRNLVEEESKKEKSEINNIEIRIKNNITLKAIHLYQIPNAVLGRKIETHSNIHMDVTG